MFFVLGFCRGIQHHTQHVERGHAGVGFCEGKMNVHGREMVASWLHILSPGTATCYYLWLIKWEIMCFTIWTPVSRCACVCVCVCSSIHIITFLCIWARTFSLMWKHLKLAQIYVVGKKKHITFHVFLWRQNIFLYLEVARPRSTRQYSCHIWWLYCCVFMASENA